jgi:hypothetical protein
MVGYRAGVGFDNECRRGQQRRVRVRRQGYRMRVLSGNKRTEGEGEGKKREREKR